VIGSIRRECLDHVIVFQESSLRRTLHSYFEYYHRSRTHLSLAKDSPEPRAIQPPEMGSVVAIPQVDYITATNDGLRERARTYNATGCLCSTVWNPYNQMAQWRRFIDFPRVPVIRWQKIVPNENPVQPYQGCNSPS
jgi:hypothetical protein